MPGPKHKSSFKPGQRLNGFVLLENYRHVTNGRTEWLWKCQCDCGNIFNGREHTLLKRYGCHSCTNAANQKELSIQKSGIDNAGVKNRIYREYKRGAEKRNLDFNLTLEEFLDIESKPCHYCGEKPTVYEGNKKYMQKLGSPWKHNGIDRLDTNKGYTVENCVPCCSKCNYAKHDLSLDEFKAWVTKAYKHLNLERSTTIPEGSTDKCLEMEISQVND